jgi:phosphatidate cytidylyltransferase
MFETLEKYPNLLNSFGGIFGLLVLASLILPAFRGKVSQKNYRELQARIKTWWMMVVTFTLAIVLTPRLTLALFAFISFLAFKEYLTLVPTRRADRRVLLWAYLAIPVQYYWVHIEWYGLFIIFIPIYMFLFLPFRMILIGQTDGFLRSVGTIHWGLMTTTFSISHVTFFLALNPENNPVAGGAGLILYLVALTQMNDVFQYIWGKSLGRNKIVPQVSPNKTWEGFLGGVATTTFLAWLAGSWLTPMTPWEALGAGLLIGVSGFVGDVTISAIKRDLQVKDSGNLLPGHGGILDRIDSLTFTAPLFFHYIYYFATETPIGVLAESLAK